MSPHSRVWSACSPAGDTNLEGCGAFRTYSQLADDRQAFEVYVKPALCFLAHYDVKRTCHMLSYAPALSCTMSTPAHCWDHEAKQPFPPWSCSRWALWSQPCIGSQHSAGYHQRFTSSLSSLTQASSLQKTQALLTRQP